MCTKKRIKQLLAILLAVVFVLVPFRFENLKSAASKKAEAAGFTTISSDTTWKKTDNLVFSSSIEITNGATLTIEKGCVVKFSKGGSSYAPVLIVSNGRIIADGTAEEKIVFTTATEDDNFGISFRNSPEAAASFFRYVQIIKGGYEIFLVGDVGKNLLNIANAATWVPAFNFSSGKLHIENSEFKDNYYTAVRASQTIDETTANDYLEIVNSNFTGSLQNVAVNSNISCRLYTEDGDINSDSCNKKVLLKNNYYDHELGPKQAPNYIYGGERIDGNYTLDSFKLKELIADPVVVVPGIMGSEQSLGQWKLDPILHTYDDLVDSLEKNGYQKNKNLFEFPYDWRNNNETSAHYLQAKIEGIILDTKVSKVDVVAHSMGGLVARSYIEGLDGVDYENTIGKLITLGTPNKGAPKDYLYWEAGEGFFGWQEKIMRHHFQEEAKHAGYSDLQKYIQEKVTSIKELLPDYSYLKDVSSGAMKEYPNNYPRNTFLEELNLGTNLEKMKGVYYANIFGKLDSSSSTISSIRVVSSTINGKWQNGMPETFYDKNTGQGLLYDNGDEVVPLESVKGIPVDKSIEINASHQELPNKAQCEVFKQLTGKSTCAFVDNWHVTNVLLFNVFSPIDIQIVSPSGKKVGKDFATGEILNEIPGAFYSGYDGVENEFVTIPNPEEGEYKILTQGTGSGDYRVEATKISENQTDPFNTNESTVNLQGIAAVGKNEELKVQVKGDEVLGGSDSVAPETKLELAGTKGAADWFKSDVVVTLSAVDNENGSGVDKTTYSLDDGATWTEYAKPFSISKEGTSSVQYFSVDKQGNIEKTKIQAVKLDKTAPETKITFNPNLQEFEIKGIDNLSQNVAIAITQQSTSTAAPSGNSKIISWLLNLLQKNKGKNIYVATLTDEAGNVTNVVFEKKRDENRRIELSILSVAYNGASQDLQTTSLKYKWLYNAKQKNFLMLATNVRTSDTFVEAHYRPKKNLTILMQKPQELDERDVDDDVDLRPTKEKLAGLVVVGLQTEKGKIKITY